MTLDKQLDATELGVDAWEAQADVSGDAAPQAMLEVGIDMAAPESQMNTLEAEIKEWEEKLNGLVDDAQLANVDLQNMLQKQQQTLQMMSNISKMLYDTAQSVSKMSG